MHPTQLSPHMQLASVWLGFLAVLLIAGLSEVRFPPHFKGQGFFGMPPIPKYLNQWRERRQARKAAKG